MTLIGVGIKGRQGSIAATATGAFPKEFVSVCNVIFAYAGHVAFFNFISVSFSYIV